MWSMHLIHLILGMNTGENYLSMQVDYV